MCRMNRIHDILMKNLSVLSVNENVQMRSSLSAVALVTLGCLVVITSALPPNLRDYLSRSRAHTSNMHLSRLVGYSSNGA
jgi:hypothetical protein